VFESALDELSAGVDAIEGAVRVGEFARSASSQAPPPDATAQRLSEISPSDADWRLFDHCAAVTRLYAVFEDFVHKLVGGWLDRMPPLYGDYNSLPEPVRKAYRVGTAEILAKYGSERYAHLTEDQVVRGLSDGLAGREYTIGVDQFFVDDRNLRAERLHTLFAQMGIDDLWGRLTENRDVDRWLRGPRGDQTTAQAELNALISYRNLAAHGSVDEILSPDAIAQLCAFVRLLGRALVDAVSGEYVVQCDRLGYVEHVGQVIREFTGQIIGVRVVPGRIAKGDTLVIRDKRNAYDAAVESLEINNARFDEVLCEEGTEVGLKVDRSAKVGAVVVRLVLPSET
jgi:hypothetical protein